jgi:hypothetical protein
MNQDYIYYVALIPDTYKVLGIRLQPFSIGHYILLHRLGSPFITGERKPTLADFIQSVLICAGNWKEGLEIETDPLQWLKMRIWRWRFRKKNFAKEIENFDRYIEAGMQCPALNKSQKTGRATGAPWVWTLANFISEKRGIPIYAAFDFPFSLAQCEYVFSLENEGKCEVKNSAELEFEAYCAEQDAKEKENK